MSTNFFNTSYLIALLALKVVMFENLKDKGNELYSRSLVTK